MSYYFVLSMCLSFVLVLVLNPLSVIRYPLSVIRKYKKTAWVRRFR